jgi:ABC-type transport system substrate-binding protein
VCRRRTSRPASSIAELREVVGTNYRLLSFNTSVKPYDDVRVRQAIAHAVDKKKIVDVVWGERGVVAEGPIPPTSWAFDERFKGLGYNLNRAKQLMAEAGHAFEMISCVCQEEPARNPLLIDQLKQINVTVSPSWWISDAPRPIAEGNYDVLRVAGRSTEPDLRQSFHSSAIGG